MTAAPSPAIRGLFSTRRPIDRPIEKVIDYYASDEKRLAAEIEEYEVTARVEKCFRRFLDAFGAGVRGGQVTEIGIWVAGFYGSGKSSFTKYLGFALDPDRRVGDRSFLELLCERLHSKEVAAEIRTLAAKEPTAVVLLDLGAEQLADAATATVATVLYWKVLQWAGYSKEKKLAQLEITLEARGLKERFLEAHARRYPGKAWTSVHNDPLIGVAQAAQIVPELLPEFPTPESFSKLKFDEAVDSRERTKQLIELVRRKSGRKNILFLIDEAGQYVASRRELILNLDGLSRNLKELGEGRVWIVATGQQTLTEIVEKAAHNTAELNKLRDRFPIAIELDAQDIREITYRRLLTKREEGATHLSEEFARQGQSLLTHTRLSGTILYKSDPDAEAFTRLYPFLPQHFDILLEMIRTLARTTGGIGLRSAIRVIQDLLVDASKALPAGTTRIADRPVLDLACVDDFFDTLRADIAKAFPHVTAGVARVAKAFPNDPLALRVAKAIGALQPIEGFPRTAENIAALLYPRLGAPSLLGQVRDTLRALVAEKECSVVEDPQAGGFLFLSEGVKPLRDKRNAHVPTTSEVNGVRAKLLEAIFDPPPSAKLENVKDVKAGVRYGKASILGDDAEIQLRIEPVDAASFEARRTALLTDTNALPEYRSAVAWIATFPPEVEDLLVEVCRSEWLGTHSSEREADRDVAQFLRAEKRTAESNRGRAQILLTKALHEGTLVFKGTPRAATEIGVTLEASARAALADAAGRVFGHFRLVPIRPATELAPRFLGVERLDRIPRDLDPLKVVATKGGSAKVNVDHPALAETLRVFRDLVDKAGGRLQGSAILEHFAAPPYGWSKDATRYLFAALLVAGEIELHTGDGVLKTAGPQAQEAFKSTATFNRAGFSKREGRPSLEALDRTANRLQEMFGIEVLPSEERISRAVQKHVPDLLEKIGPLPDRLRLLDLAGSPRARRLLEAATDLVKQDAGGATAILGGKECALPGDVTWAHAVTEALEGGAEAEVRDARAITACAAEVASLFPDAETLALAGDEAKLVHEVLASEGFHDRLPDLRRAIRTIADRARALYVARRRAFLEGVEAALRDLAALPEWARTGQDVREAISRRLEGMIPGEAPPAGEELSALRLLLARSAGLGQAAASAATEVRKKGALPVPAPVPIPPVAVPGGSILVSGPVPRTASAPSPIPMPGPVPGPAPTAAAASAPTPVRAGELLSDATLRSADEIDPFLATLRERLTTLIAAHGAIRIDRT